MKNIFYLTTAFIISFCYSSHAQFAARAGMNLNTATIDGDFEDSNEDVDAINLLSFEVGIEYQIEINDQISFHPSAVLAQSGFLLEDDLSDEEYDLVLTGVKLYLPIAYAINDQFYGEAGISFLKHFSQGGDIDDDDDADELYLVDDDIAGSNYFLLIGAGYQINDQISLKASYSLGLGEFYSENDFEGVKQNILNISGVYSFN